jgi:hypothetical protein
MSTRSKKRKSVGRTPKTAAPNWPRLKTRFTAVMKDVRKEVGRSWVTNSRQLERGLEAKLLPSLKRAQRKLEGLIAHLEKRV